MKNRQKTINQIAMDLKDSMDRAGSSIEAAATNLYFKGYRPVEKVKCPNCGEAAPLFCETCKNTRVVPQAMVIA